jgi:hypothetical protein
MTVPPREQHRAEERRVFVKIPSRNGARWRDFSPRSALGRPTGGAIIKQEHLRRDDRVYSSE